LFSWRLLCAAVVGANLNAAQFVNFINDGGNLIVAGKFESSDLGRELASQVCLQLGCGNVLIVLRVLRLASNTTPLERASSTTSTLCRTLTVASTRLSSPPAKG